MYTKYTLDAALNKELLKSTRRETEEIHSLGLPEIGCNGNKELYSEDWWIGEMKTGMESAYDA